MRIQVSWKHISESKRARRDSNFNFIARLHCPVACAIKEALGGERLVAVDTEEMRVNGRCYGTPLHIAEFIEAFDNEHSVKPCEFNLPLISQEGDAQ